MFDIGAQSLRVKILDPINDRERFGTRYCTGGSIFQVTDTDKGPLMSGPTYPDSFNTFDGQGIPDSFNHQPLRDRRSPGAEALVLGIGICDLQADRITDLCLWQTAVTADQVDMRTQHAFEGYEVSVRRRVSVSGRTVRSQTWLANLSGALPLPVTWFPHPFYPQPAQPDLCAFNLAVDFPDNAGYTRGSNGFIRRASASFGARGQFLALSHEPDKCVTVLQRHDLLGLVAAVCDYAPAGFPIWGNERCFSWEPHYVRQIQAGEECSWKIDYHF